MVRSGELLTVVTPRLRTSSGRRGSACETRFCTNCWALSGSVPRAKVTVSVITPSVVAWLPMQSMPSTPLIDSSSGVATVSAITLGLAPGYCARTTTEGGATSGYSEMGRPRNAMSPPQEDEHRQNPGEDGAVDEKAGQVHGCKFLASLVRTLRRRATCCCSWLPCDHPQSRPWRSWVQAAAPPRHRGARVAGR